MTVWFVLGTAAELIKVYPLILGVERRGWRWRVLATGQSDTNFRNQYRDFALSEENLVWPMAGSQDLRHSAQALSWFIRAFFGGPRRVRSLALPKPDYVVVHGDTLSTLIGAWWARSWRVPVAHVEAGLRSGHWWQPFPEEVCRRLVSRLARIHFAPDAVAVSNLERGGVRGQVIDTGGNSLLDAVRAIVQVADRHSRVTERPICICNLHRFENLNRSERWRTLIEATVIAAERYRVIFVMHPQTEHKLKLNPDDQRRLRDAEVELRPRMMFREFIELVLHADLLISDGGSNQEESYYLGKPCLLLRETTERREGLGGNVVLSNFDPLVIREVINHPERLRREPLSTESSPTEIMLRALERR